MNRILLKESELDSHSCLVLPAADYRVRHLRQILRAEPGKRFEAGLLNTEISGQFCIWEMGSDGSLAGCFMGGHDESQKLRWQPVRMGLGLLRPPVLKRLLRDLASAGVEEIALIQTELCEGAYNKSRIWDDLEQYLILGAEQGRINRLPRLLYGERRGIRLTEYLARAESFREQKVVPPQNCMVLTEEGQKHSLVAGQSCIIALGPERGWTANELQSFRDSDFTECSLGPLTLRTEMAAHLALGLYLL